MKFTLTILCTILMMFMISSTEASFVFLNGSFTPIYVRTPYLHGSSAKLPYNLTTYLIPLGRDAKGMQSCKGPDPTLAPFMKGALVMVIPDNGCSVPKHALIAQEAGAAAVLILAPSTHLFSKLYQTNPGPGAIKIPTIFIELYDFTKVIAPTFGSGGQVIFKIEANPSPIDDLKKGAILFYQIFLEILNIAGVGLMVYKIVDYFRKKNELSVSILVFFSTLVALLAYVLYLLDPWAYWDAIPYFAYLIMTLNIGDLFLTFSLLLLTFHLSNILFSTTRYSKYVFIPYIASALLMTAFLVSILVDLVYQFTYSFGELTPNSSQWFRCAVFILIAIFYSTCNIIFLRRLLPMFDLKSGTKDRKKNEYIQLITVTFGILFLIIIQLILRGLVLHNDYLLNPIPILAINGVQAGIMPFYALFYFFMFKTREAKKSTNTFTSDKKTKSENSDSNNSNYKKFETE